VLLPPPAAGLLLLPVVVVVVLLLLLLLLRQVVVVVVLGLLGMGWWGLSVVKAQVLWGRGRGPARSGVPEGPRQW
jgi:hypothetical protein